METVMTAEFGIVLLIVIAIGGAVGARLAGAPTWKGALVMAGSTLAIMALFEIATIKSMTLGFVAQIVIVGIMGGSLKLSGRQIGSVALGGILAVGILIAAGESLIKAV